MYLVAFGITYLLVMYRIKKEGYTYSKDTIQDYFVWAILGLLVGARLGYVLFYNTGYYLEHPLEVVFPFDPANGFRYIGISGMSYHGGAIGVFVEERNPSKYFFFLILHNMTKRNIPSKKASYS